MYVQCSHFRRQQLWDIIGGVQIMKKMIQETEADMVETLMNSE